MKYSIFFAISVLSLLVVGSCNNQNAVLPKRDNSSGFTQIDSLCRKIEESISANKFHEADILLEDLLMQSVSLNNNYGKLKYHYFKGFKDFKEGNIKSAIRYMNFCAEKARNENLYIYTDAFITLGDIYNSINNSYLAHGYYLEGLDLAATSKNFLIMRNVYSRIGLVLFQQKQYTQAREYFTKALDIYKHTASNFNDFYKIQELTNNIGLTYFEQKDFPMAMEYFKDGLHKIYLLRDDSLIKIPFLKDVEAQEIKINLTRNAEGVILGNIGRIFLKNNQLDSAEKYFKKNIEINLESIEARDATLSLLYLMKVYLKKSDFKSFQTTSAIAEESIKKHHFNDLKAKHYLLLSKYHAKIGDYKNAFLKQNEYKQLNDSLTELTKEILFTDIPTVYFLLKRSNTIELFEKEAELKTWQNRILSGLVIIIFLSLLLIWIYLVKERRIRSKFQQLNAQLKVEKNKLEQANKELELLNKEKTMILGVVAHDLRSPLNIIKGFAELLKMEENISEANKKSIDYIQQSCDKARETINDLIEISRFGINEQLKYTPINVIKMLEQTIARFKNFADEKNIHIDLNCPHTGELIVNLNEPKFQRLIDNLISNAIKFTNKDGIVKIDASKDETHFILKVSDNGIGIPPEFIPNLFDRFTKAGRYGTAGEKSLGLGMSIVKMIVDQHHGTIEVDSQVDKGTTFTVKIPLL